MDKYILQKGYAVDITAKSENDLESQRIIIGDLQGGEIRTEEMKLRTKEKDNEGL